MKIDLQTTSPIERKLTIEVPQERVHRELEKAYTQLGRRVKLRGFRPGHVPRGVLERNFKAEVERDVVEKLVSSTFAEAALEKGVEAVSSPSVSLDGGLVADQPFRFSATVEVKPAVEPRDYRGLAVTRRVAAVGDAEVEAELAKLQDSYAELVPVEGRETAEEGDYALIDHVGTIDGQPFEGGKAEGVTVRAAQGKVEEGFLPALVGKRLGETAEFTEPFAADHRDERLRGKLAHMQVVLKGLKTKRAAPLDDALAVRVGIEGIATLDELRARIRSDLQKRETRRAEGEFRDALIKAALERNGFEVPPAMVERAIDGMLEGTVARFARMGVDVRQLDLDVARLRGDLREQALLQVRGGLFLEAVARVEGIEVTEEDLQAEAARLADEAGVPLQKVQQQMRGAEARAALEIKVREEKALAVLSQAAVVETR